MKDPSSYSVPPKESKNPHEVSLGGFLYARAVPVREGYVKLRNGQILRKDAYEKKMEQINDKPRHKP